MRTMVIAVAVAALCGTADALEAKARLKQLTPSIMVEDIKQPRKASRQRVVRPQASHARRPQANRARRTTPRPSGVPYRYVGVPRPEINNVGRNIAQRNEFILRRQQLEMQRQIETNFIRREIEQRANTPAAPSHTGCSVGSPRC